MEVEQVPANVYQSLGRESWQRFFDAFTTVVEGRAAEIEVFGLGLGDQIEAEWLPLNGISFDPKSDTLFVSLENADTNLDHEIAHPREIFVRLDGVLLEQVFVVDGDGQQHLVRLRHPIEIPERV